jgi:hypothetical protein
VDATMTQPQQSFGTRESYQHSEGPLAAMIEQQTAKLPSDLFLWAAGGSIVGSLLLKMMERHHDALFVGQWAPTFLILGLYNKIVKVAGTDRAGTNQQ